MGCQSIFTRMSDVPSTYQQDDMANGNDVGKLSTIVLPRPSRLYRPDREVAKLRAGADLNHIDDGKPVDKSY